MRFPRRDCKLFRTVKRSDGRAARTWRTAIGPVLIVQAIFCDDSACCLQPKQLQSIRSKCSMRRAGLDWVPKMSTPSSAVLVSVRVERRQIYLNTRRHAGRMVRAMATRADGRRRRKVFLRLLFTPSCQAPYAVTQSHRALITHRRRTRPARRTAARARRRRPRTRTRTRAAGRARACPGRPAPRRPSCAACGPRWTRAIS